MGVPIRTRGQTLWYSRYIRILCGIKAFSTLRKLGRGARVFDGPVYGTLTLNILAVLFQNPDTKKTSM